LLTLIDMHAHRVAYTAAEERVHICPENLNKQLEIKKHLSVLMHYCVLTSRTLQVTTRHVVLPEDHRQKKGFKDLEYYTRLAKVQVASIFPCT